MDIRQFRRKYDLELIPNSFEGIIPGTLVWDPIIGPPVFDFKGMPNHIYNAFYDADLIGKDALQESLAATQTTELVEAHFAERMIEIDVDFATTLEEPKIGEIEAKFGLKEVKKFTFGDLKARSMTNLERVKIDEYLEILKKDHWKFYDGKIRRVFMITELYYGSIKVVIDKKITAEFEAAFAGSALKVKPGLHHSTVAEYTFDHGNVPFAMRIERVKHFNG